MASPRSVSAKSLAASDRRYRRSSFNGAKQLKAAQAPSQRILGLLILLALALLVAVAVIVGVHLQGSGEQLPSAPASEATHPASH